MATNPIYVETEEEIPEVVERLRKYPSEDTMLVLPMRSRIGQSRFNFQLLRNYSARMGKRVTVVCDDPAVQKMASESGFPVFGAIGPEGEGIVSEAEAPPPVKKWWQRARMLPTTHVGIAAQRKLITKTATEMKPGRFLLYVTAATILALGIFAAAVYIPSASVTLVAQASPFSEKDIEIQAQPGKAPIGVRLVTLSKSASQGFKTTGLISVPLAPATGSITLTNGCPKPGNDSPGITSYRGTRFVNSNGIEFAQTSSDVMIPWGQASPASVIAVVPGTSGNVGDHTINSWAPSDPNPYDCFKVTNPQATGNGTNPSQTPQMTEADFDSARAQLENSLHQQIAQILTTSGRQGEKLSDTIIYGAPVPSTDHQPSDKVPSFSMTMTISGEGAFYSDSDVQKAYQTYLAQRVPNDQQLLTESPIQVTYRMLSDAQGGNLTFVGSASAYIAPKLDLTQIQSQIVGRPLSSAKFILQRLPVRSVAIKEEPMALPLMPLLSRRIDIHYVVQSGAPSASAVTGTTSTVANPTP
ncbi:MAG TPA: hypothetical protein VJT78_08130 [Candidatus Dormibacteraeota bacterium]|nr:hypothetical protein [Candidatus Dormibacteraeota bacterium]